MAFLKYREEELCSRTSDLRLHEYLRSIGETMVNINKISHVSQPMLFSWHVVVSG